MTEFSSAVYKGIEEWAASAVKCNGNIECLENCGKELRKKLDQAFPDSKKVEIETDKINYMLSSIFFLVNRMSKASVGLAEFDRAIKSVEGVGKASLETSENRALYDKFHEQLDLILGKYF